MMEVKSFANLSRRAWIWTIQAAHWEPYLAMETCYEHCFGQASTLSLKLVQEKHLQLESVILVKSYYIPWVYFKFKIILNIPIEFKNLN